MKCQTIQTLLLAGIFIIHLILVISLYQQESFLNDVQITLHNVQGITTELSRPETQQMMSTALHHSNHLMSTLRDTAPQWKVAVNNTLFELTNVLRDLHQHPEWIDTLTKEMPKVTHESEEWRHNIANTLRSVLSTTLNGA